MKAIFKKRLLKLADIIEGTKPIKDYRGKPVKFDMASWQRREECGTAACVAGHAAILAEPGERHTRYDVEAVAKKWLALNHKDAWGLFYANDYRGKGDRARRRENITARRAAKVLRNFAETGKIDWNMKLT